MPTYVNKAKTAITMKTGVGNLAAKPPLARAQNVTGQITSTTSTKCSSLSVQQNM